MANSRDLPPDEARLAAELSVDLTAEHLGEVYAKALLQAAENAGQAEAIVAEFDSLVADVLDRFPDFETLLGSWFVSQDEKQNVIDRVFRGRASPLFFNFLRVLARHGRLDVLRPIRRLAHDALDRMRGRVRVQLTTAAPVDDRLLEGLREELRSLVDGEPVVRHSVDPDLIGGALVRVGDTVYDGSIASQLKNLRQQMIDRSVHEIQSRRDRFRHPARD